MVPGVETLSLLWPGGSTNEFSLHCQNQGWGTIPNTTAEHPRTTPKEVLQEPVELGWEETERKNPGLHATSQSCCVRKIDFFVAREETPNTNLSRERIWKRKRL